MIDRHDDWLDDVAAYALGTLRADEAARVREHLRLCERCRAEYAALQPAVVQLAYSAQACPTGVNGPQVSPLLKTRIMRAVRTDAAPRPAPRSRSRSISPWPAYLVAAACIALTLLTSISNIDLTARLHATQSQLAQNARRIETLQRIDMESRAMVADLLSADAQRFPVNNGEVVRRGAHLYIAMRSMTDLGRGKTYQAWTLARGSTTMTPSVTFEPDRSGGAVVALPVNATGTSAVAVSVEPFGGSKQPTTAPLFVVSLR